MSRDEGIRTLSARPDGAHFRYLELLKNEKLVSVVIEDTRRPGWRVVGRTWKDALHNLSIEAR